MNKWIFVSCFILGHALVLIAYSAIAVYGFEYYEKGYGESISFQISLWFVMPGAVSTGIGFATGVVISEWISKFWISFILGGLFAVSVLGSSGLVKLINIDTGLRQVFLFGFWLLGSALIPMLAPRVIRSKNG